jgi:hypothetical protein
MHTAIPAVVFVGIVVGLAVAAALGLAIAPGSGADALVLSGGVLLYTATGFAIGKWRAMLLALVTVVVAVPFGDPDADGLPTWAYVLIDTVVLWGPLMLAGIALRKLVVAARRRRSRPSRGPLTTT